MEHSNIFKAIIRNNLSDVKNIIEKHNNSNEINYTFKFTPLILACYLDHEDIIEYLLKDNINKNNINKNNINKDNININAVDNNGSTALIYACCNTNINVVKMILSKPDVKINIRNLNGLTALDIAKDLQCNEIIKMLKRYNIRSKL